MCVGKHHFLIVRFFGRLLFFHFFNKSQMTRRTRIILKSIQICTVYIRWTTRHKSLNPRKHMYWTKTTYVGNTSYFCIATVAEVTAVRVALAGPRRTVHCALVEQTRVLGMSLNVVVVGCYRRTDYRNRTTERERRASRRS